MALAPKSNKALGLDQVRRIIIMPSKRTGPRKGRRLLRRALATVGALALLSGGIIAMDSWRSLGARPQGERLERIRRSPQYKGDRFINPLPRLDSMWKATKKSMGWLSGKAQRVPQGAVPVVNRSAADFETAPPEGLRVTPLGHSTVLVEIDGRRFLTDPHWSRRNSPTRFVGPVRFFPPPLALEDLPPLDGVVISHDHHDHLDPQAVKALLGTAVPFVVPLGVGAHLEYWGVPPERIIELDWGDQISLGGVAIHCTPARHFSGRALWDFDATLWAGWALVGPHHRVFFSGDSAMFPGFREIGESLGPFDVTLLDTGAYDETWADYHMGPEQAVAAHGALRGRLLVPVHWGTFNLAFHSWVEPAERVMVAAREAGVALAITAFGQSVLPSSPPELIRWWPDVPWQRAEEHRVVSSGLMGGHDIPGR